MSIHKYAFLQAPDARPVMKALLEEGEELKIIENHFAIPVSLLISCCVCMCVCDIWRATESCYLVSDSQ